VKPEGVPVTGCRVEGCESRLRGGLGYCSKHYQRLKKLGPDHVLVQPVTTGPDDDRFWAKVDKSAGDQECWPWRGKIEWTGYGRIWWNGKDESAHRVSYILTHGHIPKTLTIDHICKNRACQNPAHLRAVTHRENNLASSSRAAINAAKTHCKWGHEFTDANTYLTKRGQRHCRACIARRNAEAVERKRQRRLAVK
jgi:HNH endonuclease